MAIAHFQCVGGASGDMILGAFVDAGMPLEALREGLAGLGLPGFEIEARRVSRRGICATQVVVHTEEQRAHRHLEEIDAILQRADLPKGVKEDAGRVFRKIAEAEAEIHGVRPEDVHFHEVGAMDTIVDVVGAMIAARQMGLRRVTVSPFRLGQGTMEMAHGTFPIPAPATVALLRGWPVLFTGIPAELTTPTGAAVLTTLARRPQPPPSLHISAIGYGAGSRDLESLPNVLRLVLGQEAAAAEEDEAMLVEANIDDMNPELYPHLMDRLFAAGAMDVYLTPVLMKKGRPGTLVSVLVPPDLVDTAVEVLFRESTTIGVRMHPLRRRKLVRRVVEVQTSLGPVMVKEIDSAAGTRRVPEYEECRRLAVERGLPVREVFAILEAELRDLS